MMSRQDSIPRRSERAVSARTMFRRARKGNREPQGVTILVKGRRARRSLAASDDVCADDEVPVGIDRPTGSDHRGPPPAGVMPLLGWANHGGVSGEGMGEDPHRPQMRARSHS